MMIHYLCNLLIFTPPPNYEGPHVCLTQSVSYFLFFALTAAISATFRRVCGRGDCIFVL
jgi:hypothetical protein